MKKTEKEWQKEQKRVGLVTEKINERIEIVEQSVSEAKLDVINIRKNFFEDVTTNFDNTDEAVETYASIKQQAELLSEREQSHRHTYNELQTLRRLKQSPYFGRIDFLEDGEQQEECMYLGIRSFYDENTEQFLIYDWRAPISSLYYDYSLGRVQYKAPHETVEGEMTLKRQFIIRDSQIEGMFDTGVTIGDTLLQEVLGKNANMQMKSIVSTIQKEQNKIIRNEKSRLLIVQGTAGSGKTSAALQRVAYLLYRYRDTLHADQIILFSPNPLFNSYVSTVLPELGEDNMRQTTFQDYLESQIDKKFQLEDVFHQIEYVLTEPESHEYFVRMEGIRYKASTSFVEAVDNYLTYLQQEGMVFKDVKFRGKTIVSKERIEEQFYAFDSSVRIPNRIKLTSEWLLKELKKQEKAERKELWVEKEMQLLSKDVYAKFHKELQREKRYSDDTFDDFEREENMLAEMIVKKRFKPLRKRVKKYQFINMSAVYIKLFSDSKFILQFTTSEALPKYWEDICRETVGRMKDFHMAYEDATPYLYIKGGLEDVQKNTSVQHIFIDEAQDYSAFQFAFLKRLFPHSKMTILGDFNQRIHAHAAENEFSKLCTLHGEERSETIVLNRSYRSTKPIIEFTRQLIQDGDHIEPFQRDGTKPVVVKVDSRGELVEKIANRIQALKSNGHKTIAIICKTVQESEEAYASLKSLLPINLIQKETTSFHEGVLIIPSYLAKGVEFDAVIMYNASNDQYGRENERKLFYTACTRAMHELYLYYVGEISSFVSAVSPEKYLIEV